MSDGTVYNLLRNSDLTRHELSAVAAATTGKAATYIAANIGNAANPAYDSAGMHFTGPTKDSNPNSGVGVEFAASDLGLVKGDTYAFSVEAARLAAASDNNGVAVWQYSSIWWNWWAGKATSSKWSSGAGVYHASFVYDGSAYVYLLMSVGMAGSVTVTRIGLYHAASAAWAPAEGETLAGGGALMSANLLDGVTPTPMSGTTEDGGVWHCPAKDGKYDRIAWNFSGMSALTANQTYHLGLSVKGASANASGLHMVIAYKDAAGNRNWAWSDAMPVGTEWSRSEATVVVPSGMTMTALTVSTDSSAKLPEVWLTSPTLSLGSPVCLASSAHTPYATQDHVSVTYATKASLKVTSDAVTAEVTERGKLAGRVGTLESTSGTHASKLEQLASSIRSLVKGESTYTDPDGKSATSGIYSLVTQTRDSVTALFGAYTKTADLASTQAVKDAKKAGTDAQAAASAAQSTADSLATMIREDATGITVGKSADGKTYATTRTRMGALAFEVLTKAGEVASSFGEKIIELGKNSQDAVISMLGGLVTIKATSAGVSDGAWCEISTDEFVSTNGYHASRIAAGYKDETGFIPQGVAEVMVKGGEGNGGVLMYAGAHGSEGNSFAMSPAAYTLNHPEYMLSALGLGAAETYQAATTDPTLTYDSTTVLRWGRVCVMPFAVHYTSDLAPSEYVFFELPEGVRPSVEQRGTVTSCPHDWTSDYRPTLVSIGTDGKVRLNGHAAGHWLGQLVWVV